MYVLTCFTQMLTNCLNWKLVNVGEVLITCWQSQASVDSWGVLAGARCPQPAANQRRAAATWPGVHQWEASLGRVVIKPSRAGGWRRLDPPPDTAAAAPSCLLRHCRCWRHRPDSFSSHRNTQWASSSAVLLFLCNFGNIFDFWTLQADASDVLKTKLYIWNFETLHWFAYDLYFTFMLFYKTSIFSKYFWRISRNIPQLPGTIVCGLCGDWLVFSRPCKWWPDLQMTAVIRAGVAPAGPRQTPNYPGSRGPPPVP